MIGRLCGTLGLVFLLKICKYDAKLSVRELIFIWYAGMIRGAIAFGLVLRIHSGTADNRQVIVTTALMLVVFTTVFMGSTVGVLQKCLFAGVEKKKIEENEPCDKCSDDEYEKEEVKTPTVDPDAESVD